MTSHNMREDVPDAMETMLTRCADAKTRVWVFRDIEEQYIAKMRSMGIVAGEYRECRRFWSLEDGGIELQGTRRFVHEVSR